MQEIRGDWMRVLYGIPCNNNVFKGFKKVNGNRTKSLFKTRSPRVRALGLLVLVFSHGSLKRIEHNEDNI